MPAEEEYYTIREACARLKIKDQTLRLWRKKGLLRAVKLTGGRGPGTVRIAKSEVERLLEGRDVSG